MGLRRSQDLERGGKGGVWSVRSRVPRPTQIPELLEVWKRQDAVTKVELAEVVVKCRHGGPDHRCSGVRPASCGLILHILLGPAVFWALGFQRRTRRFTPRTYGVRCEGRARGKQPRVSAMCRLTRQAGGLQGHPLGEVEPGEVGGSPGSKLGTAGQAHECSNAPENVIGLWTCTAPFSF